MEFLYLIRILESQHRASSDLQKPIHNQQNNNRALTRGKSQSVRKTKPIDHSFSATSMVFGETYFSTEDAECNDLDCRINKWDGCTPIGDQGYRVVIDYCVVTVAFRRNHYACKCISSTDLTISRQPAPALQFIIVQRLRL